VAVRVKASGRVSSLSAGRRRRRRLDRVVRPAGRRPGRWCAVVAAPLRYPVITGVLCGGGLAVGAWWQGGPVAAALAAAYGTLGVILAVRRQRSAARLRGEARALDAVCDLAADLRAGAAPEAALDSCGPAVAESAAAAGMVRAAWLVSERTGAPLAEVLDRVDVQLRQAHRRTVDARAHSAGSRATTMLLTAMPAVGIAIGYGMGADPLHTLFRTGLGAVCVGVACAFHLAGLGLTFRLSTVDTS
jgi:tight adherence protein B